MPRDIIYIAGPYTGTDEQKAYRFRELTRVAAQFVKQGHIVYSPITHSHPIEQLLPEPLSLDYWMEFDETFMAVCTRCVVVKMEGWDKSKGVAREIAYFKRIGIKVEFILPRVAPVSGMSTRILEFISEYQAREQRPPTIREIQLALGFKSPRAASYQIYLLEAKGLIERRKGSRNIVVTGALEL